MSSQPRVLMCTWHNTRSTRAPNSIMIYRLWMQTWNFRPKNMQIQRSSAHQHEFAELCLLVENPVKTAYPSFHSAAMAVIWHSKSKLQLQVESILIRNVATFLSLLQFGIHKYFRVGKKRQSNKIHFSFMQCYGDYVWFNHECSLSTPLQELFSFSLFMLPESHADWVTISVTEWLIDLPGDKERGCARGEREDVRQLAVNDPCHSLLSIQIPAPPICLSEVPLDKSWVISSRRWEWALFYLQIKLIDKIYR